MKEKEEEVELFCECSGQIGWTFSGMMKTVFFHETFFFRKFLMQFAYQKNSNFHLDGNFLLCLDSNDMDEF